MSDIIAVWIVGAVVAFLIGCLLGLFILVTAWRKGRYVTEPVSGVFWSGVGPLALWLVGYPIALVTMAGLGYVFGGGT